MSDSSPILVPLDGSKNAEEAIPAAAAIARRLGVAVRMIHVVDPDALRSPVDLDRAREIFHSYVDGLAQRTLAGLSWSCEVSGGNAAEAVVEASEDASMVVLATHGRSGLHATMIGSVADKIVRGAVRPTLAIPLGHATDPLGGTVLVAMDGSEVAEAGLVEGRRLAGLAGAKVALVRAYNVPPPVGVEFVAYPVDLSSTMKEATETYLAKTALTSETTYAVFGTAIDAIVSTAERVRASLVVMTSHGKGFAQRLALGSTTDRALHTLKCPVLVVPVAKHR
jgi:nucleotide-binding universal stress UspA family protein